MNMTDIEELCIKMNQFLQEASGIFQMSQDEYICGIQDDVGLQLVQLLLMKYLEKFSGIRLFMDKIDMRNIRRLINYALYKYYPYDYDVENTERIAYYKKRYMYKMEPIYDNMSELLAYLRMEMELAAYHWMEAMGFAVFNSEDFSYAYGNNCLHVEIDKAIHDIIKNKTHRENIHQIIEDYNLYETPVVWYKLPNWLVDYIAQPYRYDLGDEERRWIDKLINQLTNGTRSLFYICYETWNMVTPEEVVVVHFLGSDDCFNWVDACWLDVPMCIELYMMKEVLEKYGGK